MTCRGSLRPIPAARAASVCRRASGLDYEGVLLSLLVPTAEVAPQTLDEQDLRQYTEGKCCHFKGAGRRRVGEGRHHAVNSVGHETHQNARRDQHKPRLPLEAH